MGKEWICMISRTTYECPHNHLPYTYLRTPYPTPPYVIPPTLRLRLAPPFLGGLPVENYFLGKIGFFHRGYPLFSESRLFKKFFPGKFFIFSKTTPHFFLLGKTHKVIHAKKDIDTWPYPCSLDQFYVGIF